MSHLEYSRGSSVNSFIPSLIASARLAHVRLTAKCRNSIVSPKSLFSERKSSWAMLPSQLPGEQSCNPTRRSRAGHRALSRENSTLSRMRFLIALNWARLQFEAAFKSKTAHKQTMIRIIVDRGIVM